MQELEINLAEQGSSLRAVTQSSVEFDLDSSADTAVYSFCFVKAYPE